MKSKLNKSSGFTLLEILLVVGIISILAGIVIVAINPTKQLATIRNTERKSDIKQIDSALTQYYIDNGHYPTTTPSVLTEICKSGNATYPQTDLCTGFFDLSVLVPDYITAIPSDPQATSTEYGTGYSFKQDATTRKIGVHSDLAELGQDIVVGMAASSTPDEEEEEGLDANTLALLHFDGTNESTTFTDEVGGTATGYGDAIISTAQSKFGGASSYFNELYTTYIVPVQTGWESIGTGPFTIDFWIRPASLAQYKTILSSRTSDTGGNDDLLFIFYDGGQPWLYAPRSTSNSEADQRAVGSVEISTWTHIAIVGNGATDGAERTITLYVDGSKDTGGTWSIDYDFGGKPLWIGGDYPYTDFGSSMLAYSGYIDEFRLSNTTRWTSNFTPPTSAY